MLSCPSYVGCCVYHVSAQTICLSAIARPTAADPHLIVIMTMITMKIIAALIMCNPQKVIVIVIVVTPFVCVPLLLGPTDLYLGVMMMVIAMIIWSSCHYVRHPS